MPYPLRALALLAVLAALALFPVQASPDTVVFNADFNSDTIGSPPSTSPAGPPAGDSISLITPGSSSILVAGPNAAFATNSARFHRIAEIGGSPILVAYPEGRPFTSGPFRVTWRSAAEQVPGYYGFAAITDSSGYSIVTVNYSGSTVKYQDSSGVQDTGVNYDNFAPNLFQVDVDLDARTFDLSIDGVLVGDDRGFQYAAVSNLDRFMFQIGGTEEEAYLLDDVSIAQVAGLPDLTGTISGPPSACLGQAVGDQIQLSVTNSSAAPTGAFFVGVYVSADAQIDTSDHLLVGGRGVFDGLAPGETLPVALSEGAQIPLLAPTGSVYLGILVDEFNYVPESDESNNFSAVPITISGCGEIADLALTVQEPEIGAGAFAVPIADIPIGSVPLRSTAAVEGAPLRSTPLRSTPLRSTPLRSTGLGDLPLNTILLSSVVLLEGSWSDILAGTPLQNVPTQNITLADLFALSPLPEKIDPAPGSGVQPLTIGDIDLSSTPLRSTRFVSIALGPMPLADIKLPPPNVDPQSDWCSLLASLGFDCAALGIDVNTSTLLALDFAGVPIEQLPWGEITLASVGPTATPLRSTPLRSTPLRSTPLRSTPLRSTPVSDLTDPTAVVDCAIADCTTGGGQTLGQAEELNAILDVTVGDLLDNLPLSVLENITLSELLIAFLARSDYPWEQLPLEEMGLQEFAGIAETLHYRASFRNGGAAFQADPVVTVQLPPGFRYVAGSSVLTVSVDDLEYPTSSIQLLEDPSINGRLLTWPLPFAIGPASNVVLEFEARPGLRLGVFSSSVSVTATGASATAENQAPVRVTEHFEPENNDPATAPVAEADILYISHINGDSDFWRIPVPAANSRISVLLSHMSADNDLIMYSPAGAPLRSTPLRSTPLRSTPLRSTPFEDPGLNIDNTGESLPSEGLQDINIQGIPLRSTSTNRSTSDEVIETTALASESGFYTIQVSGYNGASSPDPYVLRIKVSAPPPVPPCSPRSFPFAGEGAAGSLPSSLPSGLNTLILWNQQQFGDLYGAAAAADVAAALNSLAGQSGLGVTGALVPVEGDATVAAAYAAWNANPCSPAAANAVVSAINTLVDGIRAANPGLEYIVLAGSDEVIPLARIPDGTIIANELEYAGDVSFGGNNALFGAAVTSHFLSDDPYSDFDPIPWLDRSLFVPDVAAGRLVEKPADIIAAVTQFITHGGMLDYQTGRSLTTAYDFLSDGGTAIDQVWAALLGEANAAKLISETWNAEDLRNAFTEAPATPDIVSLNAHYDHYRALPAAGNLNNDLSDLFTTADISAPLPGRTIYSMGCHSGLSVADVIVGSPTPDQVVRLRDWAQAYAEQGVASYVANSGFGYGDTAALALSEKLMLLFTERLDGTMSAGQALTFAKQEYFAQMGLYGVYDEKALEESVFYGLPMYQVGVPSASTASVSTLSATTAGSSLSTSTDPATGLQSADLNVQPSFQMVTTPEGEYYSVDGQTQVVHYRPIQPRTETDVTVPGLTAHGALITAAASADNPSFNPVFARPVVDLSAHEPEADFGDVIFPTTFQTINTYNSPEGERQRLVLVPGQFQATGLAGSEVIGNQRLFTSMDVRVLYSNSTDFTPPAISLVDAQIVGSFVSFTVETTDDSPDTVLDVLVLFRDGTGNWTPVRLVNTAGTDRWTGGAPVVGDRVELIVQSVDDAGNVGMYANKGDPLIVTPPPPVPEGVSVDVSGPHGSGGWFTGDTTVTISGGSGVQFQVNVNSAGFVPYTGSLALASDGVHVVQFQGSDGSSGTVTVPTDASPPVIVIQTPPDWAYYSAGQVVAADYSCADAGSGAVSCNGPVASGAVINTSAGSHVFTVFAADAAGNTSSLSHTYSAGYTFIGFFQPVDNPPVVNRAKAGSVVPVKWTLTNGAGGYIRDLAAVNSIYSVQVGCISGALESDIQSSTSSGGSGLRYDSAAEQYVFSWDTAKRWSNTCRRLVVMFADGTERTAEFRFK